MTINTKDKLTDQKRFFLEPSNSAQRQYEALRAFFIEELPSAEAAKRFGYTPGSFRVLVHDFRHDPDPQFFLPPHRGPDSAPKSDPLRESIITLRKQNFSIYDIRDLLREEGHALGTSTIAAILKEEGFSKLPRRGDDERMDAPRPLPADAAKVQLLNLKPRMLRTKFGGLFLFLPLLAKIPLEHLLQKADFPGSKKIPADYAMRSLLALKLFGNSRHSHVGTGSVEWECLPILKQPFIQTPVQFSSDPCVVGIPGRRGYACHTSSIPSTLRGCLVRELFYIQIA